MTTIKQRSWIFAAALTGVCGASGLARAQDKIPVVVTFSILADMTGSIGGDRIRVETLVGPQQDAHVLQPSPAAAAAVAKARLVISNGLGFEGWIDRLIVSSGYTGPVVVAAKGVMPIKVNGAGHAGTDPHAWQDMSNALHYVESIKQGLCAIDAAGCNTYTDNAKTYGAKIAAADMAIKTSMSAVPVEKRKVITSHDAFGYFAKAYGVVFLAPTGMSTESEASARDVAKLIRQIKTENVSALFVESISDTRLIEQIGRETNVKIGPVLYSDALSNADGPAASYLDMMRYNARELIAAMAGP